MKIAIYYDDSHKGNFSKRWIEYCKINKIYYELVDVYQKDFIKKVKEYDAFLWNWPLSDMSAQKFARELLHSLSYFEIKVFPDITTCYHYDDKIAQKYLLEAICAPFVPTYVYYSKDEAMDSVDNFSYPIVFKLRKGAGSANVRLIKSRDECIKIVKRSFDKGFNPNMNFETFLSISKKRFKDIFSITKTKSNIAKLVGKLKSDNEKNYVLFQDFMSNNSFDTRITIIGSRAFSFRRFNRDNDFRASGSGKIQYDQDKIDKRCIQIAFEVAKKVKAQSLAFDFLFDEKNNPIIVEISYCYTASAIYSCPGFWDRDFNFHNGNFYPQDCILEDLLFQ